jgi:cytosine/adenosine deaminase-related metal-dependent hydrolase
MHCLETRYQREFADAAFPRGLFPFLKDVGLLNDRLTLAHGVYLRPEEMDLIAKAGAIVSLNTCSNLRLRSGIAPAPLMAEHGVALALGIDALGFDDSEDGLRELRLAHLLHAGTGFDAGLPREQLLHAALRNGARAVTGSDAHGRLVPGAPADIALLDYEAMAEDVMPDVTPEIDVLFARACARHMRALVVGGASVVEDGVLTGIDLPAVERELYAQAQHAAPGYRTARPLLESLQATLRACYAEGLHRQTDAPQARAGALAGHPGLLQAAN